MNGDRTKNRHELTDAEYRQSRIDKKYCSACIRWLYCDCGNPDSRNMHCYEQPKDKEM